MGCRNVAGLQIVITEHPMTDDISGNAPPSVSRVIHRERHDSKHQNARTGSSRVMPVTKLNAMEQRMIARAVKRARYMSLLPYISAAT